MSSKALLVLLLLTVFSSVCSQEPELTGCAAARKGAACGYSTRDATSLSMMGWGLGLAVGIATLCALIPNNAGSSEHTTSH